MAERAPGTSAMKWVSTRICCALLGALAAAMALELNKVSGKPRIRHHAAHADHGRARADSRRHPRRIQEDTRNSCDQKEDRQAASANTSLCIPDYRYQGYKWGMSIDLNACVGLQRLHDRLPVGKQHRRGRQRRSGRGPPHELDSRGPLLSRAIGTIPRCTIQPVPCMHCENAPCELVCPVAATVHSGEGLNEMVYNRCVGTRYCSNNCPYKVRRFNFLLYSDWDTQSLYGVRNPDVTVRSRGVMEKCTYCMQRINARQDRSREAEPAHRRRRNRHRPASRLARRRPSCSAISTIPTAAWRKLKAQARNYGLLEELNTRPRTTYLARLRNPNPEIGKA